jgi:hypothetical protein
VLYLQGIQDLQGIDLTALTFSILVLFFLAALNGTRFLDIVPIARHSMIEWMSDCVLVMDSQNHLVDFYLAASETFAINSNQLGDPTDEVIGDWPEIIAWASSSLDQNSKDALIHQNGDDCCLRQPINASGRQPRTVISQTDHI